MARMEIGIVGLGRMGGNMARRLARGGVRIVGFDPDASVRESLAAEGVIEPAASAIALVHALSPRRVVWLMVPAGTTTELAVQECWPEMQRGDVLVDGGNANYKDSQRRAAAVATAGVEFVDCGVSGGVWGLDNGYAMMFGGSAQAAQAVEPFIRLLAPAPDRGWLHCGPAGSGHFAKMIHNGIEYGLMEAYAEGFEVLYKSKFPLDLHQVCKVWNRGSVIRSWLLELAEGLFETENDLRGIQPYVEDSGEGRWTIHAAMEADAPVPVIAAALFARFASRDPVNFSARFAAGLRNQFGGHTIQRADAKKIESTGEVKS